MAPRTTRAESKDATRKALLEAGLAELIEHGRKSPSLDAICERAGYTRGAFYVHFENREEFNVAVMEHVTEKFLDLVVTEERGDDLRQTVTRFVLPGIGEPTIKVEARDDYALDRVVVHKTVEKANIGSDEQQTRSKPKTVEIAKGFRRCGGGLADPFTLGRANPTRPHLP